MIRINNLKRLEPRRKQLRSNLTPAEAKLWICLQQSKLDGWKFRRQHSVSGYVLDFYCPKGKLGIELDGAGHFTEKAYKYDKNRTEYLNGAGIKIIRFENKQIFENLDGVLSEIRKNLTTLSAIRRTPLLGRREA